VTAELGFLGLLGLISIFGSVIALGWSSLKRISAGEQADIVAGFTATIIIVCAHLAYEWAFATYYVQYLLAMSIGALVGITAPLRSKRGAATLRVRVAQLPGMALHPSSERSLAD
jgi:hypothetical protein